MSEDVFLPDEIAPPLTPAKLLVCDDSPIERMALAAFLQNIGHDVFQVPDGKTAIAYIKQRQVDLVLLDLNMAGGDGFSVLSYIQEHHAALPVVVVSGMSVNEIQQKMNTLYRPILPPLLLKPVDPDQLAQIIELQLSGDLPTGSDAFP